MSLLETIERLCDLTRLQADIIKKQTVALVQAKIAAQVDDELSEMRKTAEGEFELISRELN